MVQYKVTLEFAIDDEHLSPDELQDMVSDVCGAVHEAIGKQPWPNVVPTLTLVDANGNVDLVATKQGEES